MVTLVPNEEEFLRKCKQGAWGRPSSEGGMGGMGPTQMKM